MSNTTMRTAKEWFSVQNGRTYAGDADYVDAIKEIQEDAVATARAEYDGVTPEQCKAAIKLVIYVEPKYRHCQCDDLIIQVCVCCLARLALGLPDGKDVKP